VKKSVTIKVAGQSLNLRTADDPARVQRLAGHLSSRIDELRAAAGSASAHQVALLAGLQVVDELFKAQDELKDLQERLARPVDRAIALIEEASTG